MLSQTKVATFLDLNVVNGFQFADPFCEFNFRLPSQELFCERNIRDCFSWLYPRLNKNLFPTDEIGDKIHSSDVLNMSICTRLISIRNNSQRRPLFSLFQKFRDNERVSSFIRSARTINIKITQRNSLKPVDIRKKPAHKLTCIFLKTIRT